MRKHTTIQIWIFILIFFKKGLDSKMGRKKLISHAVLLKTWSNIRGRIKISEYFRVKYEE
jgi:hypothetical protein